MKLAQFLLMLGTVFICIHAHGQIASKNSIREIHNLLYVDKEAVENDSLQRLNIILPTDLIDFSLLIWIGGGAWSYVNRNMEMDLGRRIAANGIAFVSVGHRLSSAIWKDSTLNSGIKHPEHIKDVASAFKWLYEQAPEYGYRKDNIFVGGFSSGAHLTALLSMDSTYLNEVRLSPSNIKGIVPISGAYDILNYYEVFLNSETNSSMAETHVKAVFGETKNDFLRASPTEYTRNFSIPMLLISDKDIYEYSKILEDKLLAAEYRDFQVLHIYSMGHSQLWKHLSYDKNSIYRDFIINFIKLHESSTQQ